MTIQLIHTLKTAQSPNGEPDWPKRIQAALALAEVGSPEAVEALRDCIIEQDEDEIILRHTCISALKHIDTAAAFDALLYIWPVGSMVAQHSLSAIAEGFAWANHIYLAPHQASTLPQHLSQCQADSLTIIHFSEGDYYFEQSLSIQTHVVFIGPNPEKCRLHLSGGNEGECGINVVQRTLFAVGKVGFRLKAGRPEALLKASAGAVYVHNCHFQGGARGLLVEGPAKAIVTNSDFSQHMHGIAVLNDWASLLVENTLHQNGMGITYNPSGEAEHTARDNHCYANQIGIDVAGGEVQLLNNHCEQNEEHGIVVRNEAQAILLYNLCEQNGQNGITVVHLVRCGLGENICRQNKRHGAEFDLAIPQPGLIQENEFSHNGASGLLILGVNEAEIKDNQIIHNSTGISIAGEAQPTLSNNTCSHNKRVGIMYLGQAAGLAQGNQCNQNAAGIVVLQEASPTLENNVCRGNQSGISIQDVSAPVVKLNIFEGNQLDLNVEPTARPIKGF